MTGHVVMPWRREGSWSFGGGGEVLFWGGWLSQMDSSTCNGAHTARICDLLVPTVTGGRCVHVPCGLAGGESSAPHSRPGTQADRGCAVFHPWCPRPPWALAFSRRKREERQRNDGDTRHGGNSVPACGREGLWERGPRRASGLPSRMCITGEGKGIPCRSLASPNPEGKEHGWGERSLTKRQRDVPGPSSWLSACSSFPLPPTPCPPPFATGSTCAQALALTS